MKRSESFIAGAALLAMVVFTFVAQAENGTWNWFTEGYTNGLSLEATADWNDPANWVDGVVPSGDDAYAYIVPHDQTTSMASHPTRWIKVPDAGISLGYFSTRQAAKVNVIGGPITFTKTGDSLRDEVQNSSTCPVWIYNDVSFLVKSDNGSIVNRANLCGPVSCPQPGRVIVSADYRHYLNRYATSTSELVVDEGATGRYSPGSGKVRFYARMSAPELKGVWKTVAGSPYLHRVGDVHELAPGCTVTGPGIPEGAFLRRIFAKDLIEISANATADSGSDGVELTFGAYHPTTIQHVESFVSQGGQATTEVLITLSVTKFRKDDVFRMSITNMNSFSTYYNTFIIDTQNTEANNFTTNNTYYPGTIVIHKTPSHNRLTLRLDDAHLEFAGTNNTVYGGVNVVDINDSAWLTVPENIQATIHKVKGWNGTARKDGAGLLKMTSVVEMHNALVVEEGSLLFNPTNSAATITTLAVSNNATFTLAAGTTLKVTSNPNIQAGARIVVEEGARLLLPAKYTLPMGVAFDGAGIVATACSSGGIDYEPIRATPPAGAVVGVPAFWVTAESLTNDVPSGTLVAENGTNFVARLNDWRGDAADGYHFCTNVYNKPWLVTSGTVPYIQFKSATSGGSESTKNYGLAWDVPIKNIRVVFAVLSSPSSGMGCLLGATKRLTPCDYLRGSTSSGSNLFYWNSNGNCSSANVYNAPIYRNGVEVKYNSNYNGCSDTTIVEVDALADTSADAFSICHSGQWGGRWDLCGGRLVEYIIYTNSLTYAERLQVSNYLMRKWRGEASPHKFADQRQRIDSVKFPEGDVAYALDVAEGEAITALAVDAGGELSKTGEGTLHLMDYSDPTGALRVDKGTVVVQSVDPATLALPSGAYLHLDASADSTLTKTTSGGITRVSAWADPDGGLTATLRASNSTNAPRFVENVLNGLPVLDFGAAQGSQRQGAQNDPTMRFTISRNIRTVFSVLGSKGGGNTILGGTAGRNDTLATRTSNNTAIGIWRDVQYHPGDPSLPLVTTSGNISSQMADIADRAKTEFHKNGVLVDQKTEPMGGGYDLYSITSITGHKMESDTLGGIHYAQSWGGVEFGEILYYEWVLNQDQVSDAESRLLYKWFNRGGQYRRPAVAGTVSVAAGATLSLYGGAPMTTSSVSGSGTIGGGLKIAAGGSVIVEVAEDGTIAPLVVTGTFDLSAGGVVELVGTTAKLAAVDYPVVSAASIVGTSAGWTCECANDRYRYLVRVSGGNLIVSVVAPGTLLLFR